MTARAEYLTRPRKPGITGLLLVGAALGMTGCAQQKTEGYYDPPVESTVTDAQAQGSGANYRSVIRAPSQVQIALKPPAPNRQQQNAAAAAGAPTTEDGTAVPQGANETEPAPSVNAAAQALVPQPQTYMGTLPCFSPAMQCTAQRVTLTLAPNGRWRGRVAYLDNDPKKGPPLAEQGCWDATAEHPPRVILMDGQGNPRAEFVVSQNNVLRVRSVAGQVPNLNYTLTRQPDLDPIDELAKAPALKCP